MGTSEAGPAPVIYEVRLSSDPDISARFDQWLDVHVRDMIALPGFYDARVIRADPAADGRARRIVRYRLRDRKALDDYLARRAPALRQDDIERFGDRFAAERDIYPALPAAEESGEHRCPNCGAVADRRFCASCGQEQKDFHVSFFRLIRDFLGDTLTFDSRLFRSLYPLVRRPGFLTREFIEGRRERYIPPLRLYLFISIVFFALMNTLMGGMEFTAQFDGMEPAQPGEARSGEPDTAEGDPPPAGDPETEFEVFGRDIAGESPLGQRLQENAERVKQSPALFIRNLLENVPLMMFLMLPVYALLLRVLYPLADFVYMEHLVFSLHVHALYFLVFIAQMVLGAWIRPAAAPEVDLGILQPALGTYLFFYVAFAMRRVYRQPWWATILKFLVLGLAYWIILLTGVVGLVLATFYWF